MDGVKRGPQSGLMNVKVPLTEREMKYKEKYGGEALTRMKALGACLI